MEFLGDAIVGLITSENLYRQFPAYAEGDLAKSKAYAVSEAALADAALAVGLDQFIVLSASEAAAGGGRRASILSDAFEAVVAAIYLDRGMRVTRIFVRSALMDAIRTVSTDEHRRDYKSALQERIQSLARLTPLYRIVNEAGEEHDKTFTAQAFVARTLVGEGCGKSKKAAEQAAAHSALQRLAEAPDLLQDAAAGEVQ